MTWKPSEKKKKQNSYDKMLSSLYNTAYIKKHIFGVSVAVNPLACGFKT